MADIRPEHLGETLSAYLDGELDAADTARVELLLRDDQSARDQLAALRQTVELVQALPRHRAPGTMGEDLQAQLERTELIGGFAEPTTSAEPRRTPLLAILSTAAVFAFVAGGMWFMALDSPDAGPIGGLASRSAEVELAQSERLADARTSDVRDRSQRMRGSPREKKRSVNREMRNGDTELLASATLEQKLAVGSDISSVRTHTFANEPVRLLLSTTDSRAERSVTSRLLSRLSEMGLIDAAAASKARSMDDARVAGLFYRGAAHQNFGEGGATQILVRASPHQFNKLLSQVSRGVKGVTSVRMSSGPLFVRGLSNVRGALEQLGGRGEFVGDPLGALADVLGVDRTASASREESESFSLETPGSRADSGSGTVAPEPTQSDDVANRVASRRSRRGGKRKMSTAPAAISAASPTSDDKAESFVTIVIEIANAQASSASPTQR